MQKIVVLALLAVFFSLCHARDVYEKGKASYYADKFKGHKTASGEEYAPGQLTAAHRRLPFGTYVEVTNLRNGLSVKVKINDRGPFIKGRVIDLSKAAAQQLDMIHDGVVEVELSVIK
ncbi:MAG: septal ring lytic transglycosylase RlpA family protein [Bacteroidota bacterium]